MNLLALPQVIRHAIRMRREKHRLKIAAINIVGHPKCGSTWMRFQLARLYQVKYGLPDHLLPRLEKFPSVNPRVPFINMAAHNYYRKHLAKAPPLPGISDRRIVFLARHPCDIAVSLYFHILKHAAPERKRRNGWPDDIEKRSMFDFASRDDWGLPGIITFYNRSAIHMAAMPDALLVRYEDMRADPKRELKRIVTLAGGDFSEEEIAEAVAFASFENLRKMERDNTFRTTRLRPGNVNDTDSYKVRRGKVGGFREYFSAEEAEKLEAMIDETLDPVFGYARQPAEIAL